MKGKWIYILCFALIVPVLMQLFLKGPVKPPAIDNKGEKTSEGSDRTIQVCDNGIVRKMQLEDYIVGVVLGEMPVSFEKEAIKAQSVVARTYTCRKMVSPKHSDYAVCTDSACCQAYCSQEKFLQNGGKEADLQKVISAVEETRGQVLTYQGKWIEATYFSCSGGKTEDAVAVWGSDVPYLKSVESPNEESAGHYMDTVSFSSKEFLRRLEISQDNTPIEVGKIIYTNGGGVDTIEICGKLFSGVKLRQLFGLNSTAFVITAVGDRVTITTKGFGHRVGMSQYGAEAMAVRGADYREILFHYYQGTQLELLKG